GDQVLHRWYAAFGRPRDDDRHLAAYALLGPVDQLGERPTAYLFVGLGQLAAHRCPPVWTESVGHRPQGRDRPVRRLEEHHGAAFVGQRTERTGPLARFARREPLEAEPVDRKPRQRERGEHGRRPRYD